MDVNLDFVYQDLPVVALAGRPNVGKSTLFNRLLRRRRAITSPVPGVTRDPVAAAAVLAGKPVRLVDTGGFRLDRDARAAGGTSPALDDMVVAKALETVNAADLVVLLLAAGEMTAEDEEFIELLRPRRDRLLVAVNKTEGGRREAEAWNLLSYGFDKLLMISAEHGDNIAELEEAIVSRLDFSRVRVTGANADGGSGADSGSGNEPVRIALLGKPNTGKSTLANALTGSAASLVSAVPGTTRDVVEGSFVFNGRRFLVLDTAGIRRKTKVREDIEYYSVNRAIKSIDDADVVFLILDAEEGLTEQDKKIAALAYDRGRGLIIVLNKWDRMDGVKNALQAVSDRIRFLFPQMDYAPVIAISAMNGSGLDKLLGTAARMFRQLTRRVETATLNEALARWLDERPPPTGPRTRFKLRYAAQVSANPVKFVVFASRPAAVSGAYTAYLRSRARRDLGFSLVPVSVEIRGPAGSPSLSRAARRRRG
ncbi:MAG: ribosome biogenesis GTPase Der [Treponematales bacterium]